MYKWKEQSEDMNMYEFVRGLKKREKEGEKERENENKQIKNNRTM